MKEIECPICGGLFEQTYGQQKYCPECRDHSARKKARMDRIVAVSVAKYGNGRKDEYPRPRTKICPQCGKEFQTFEGRKYCSPECENEHFVDLTHCKECGKSMRETDDRRPRSPWFCSEECRNKWRWAYAKAHGSLHTCERCGKEFIRSGPARFCSNACYAEARKEETKKREEENPTPTYTCKGCGKTFRSQVPKTFCNRECYVKARREGWKQVSVQKTRNPENEMTWQEAARRRQEKKRKAKEAKRQQYIQENGLCGICRTPYPDCIRMTSQFRYMPEGAKSPDGKKITECPCFTDTKKA